MRTTLSERGQTAVPAAIRSKLHLRPGQQIEWLEANGVVYIYPVPANPIKSFVGSAKGEGLTEALLKYRRDERSRENARRR